MKEKNFDRSLFRIFISYFGAHRKLFLIDMSCAFLVSMVDVAFPLVSRFAMYDLLPGKLYQTFFTVMIIMAVAFGLRALLYYVITFLGHRFGICVEADIREDLYQHFQKLDFDFFDKNRTGKLMNRLTGDLFEITELAHHGPEDLLISAATILGALIVMFAVEWRLALLVLIMIPLFLLVVILCRKSMVNSSGKVKQRMADINADIESTISGMKTSKAFDKKRLLQGYGKIQRFSRILHMYASGGGDRLRRMAYHGRKPELYRPHNLYIIYNYLYNSYKKTGYPGRDLYQRSGRTEAICRDNEDKAQHKRIRRPCSPYGC